MTRWSASFSGAWALGLGLWAAVLFMSAGSWHALSLLDPQRPWQDPRAQMPVGSPLKSPRTVLWMGDSVSLHREENDGPEGPIPGLAALVEERLTGRQGGLKPKGWAFKALCVAGASGPLYERWAVQLARQPMRPQLVVIPVNARSLNRRGKSGFIRRTDLGPVEEDGVAGKMAKFWRSALAQSHALLAAPFAPDPLPEPEAWPDLKNSGPAPRRRSSPQEIRMAHYGWIYGEGFELDIEVKNALLRAGLALRAAGSQVLFYATPFEREQLRAMTSDQTLKAMDAGIAESLRALKEAGFEALDLHQAFGNGFVGLPSEHLGARRRVELADRLVPWIVDQARSGPAAENNSD